MKFPRILLIGIDGVYNYGCEAIVRGTEAILRQAYPDADIVYASRRTVDDQRRLAGSQVRIIERGGEFRRYSIKNIYRKVLSIGGIRWDPMWDSLQLLKDVDAVFSIGGDLYTLGALGEYSLSFPKFGDAARRRGIPFILWGASVGPFTQSQSVERAFQKHLGRLSLITAREPATVDYLTSLDLNERVVPCADPAYVVAPEIRKSGLRQGQPLTIGLNLSPLSVRYSRYTIEESIGLQAHAVKQLIETTGAKILLIPHVVCDFTEGDDDLRYLVKLKRALGPQYKDAVHLLESDPGFIGVKKELVKCDLVIASRMHCAINALAAQVPTIFVAYSRKAMGMAEYIYGNRDWVLSLEEMTKVGALTNRVQSLRDQDGQIRAHLSKRIPEVQEDAFRPMQRLIFELEASWSLRPCPLGVLTRFLLKRRIC